jgi:hypothetical protein
MKALKIILLIVLGICLSLSLLVFGLALTLDRSLLNPDFVTEHVNQLDLAEVADEIVMDQIPADAADFMGGALDEVLTETITDLEPWMQDRMEDIITVFYDYMEGRSDSLALNISLENMKTTFRANLLAAILASPPPELEGLTPAEIEAEFNIHYSQIDEEIPSIIELDETVFDAEVKAQIDSVRQYVIHFNLVFIVLIAFIALLIALTVLTYFSVRGSTRQLGIIFLVIGGISLGGAFIARSVINGLLSGGDIPATLQTWAPQIINDALMPLIIYGAGLLVAGVVLTIISFVAKRGGGDKYDFYY